MAFEQTREAEVGWRDADREMEVINTGGHMGVWHRQIRNPGWTIDFSFEERWPDDNAIRLTRLSTSKSFPEDEDSARKLVREFLETWARMPFKLKGRTGPKNVVI
jgi:hypothetical protein